MIHAVNFGITPVRAFCIFAFSLALDSGNAADSKQPQASSSGKPVVFKDKRIRESSGLARSLRISNAIWTHNDSGDSARLFLVDVNSGETRNVCKLTNVKARDWEDIASFQINDRPMLVVGDIGSNQNDKRLRQLHFLDEPLFPANSKDETLETPVWATIEFQFDDGYPDCEAIAVDAASGAVYLATKSKSGKSGVYSLDLATRAGVSRQTARRLAPLHLPMITAMDIHPAGDRMLILTYLSVVEYRRVNDQTWQEALAQKPRFILIPSLGKQVEAVCYAAEPNRFHLSSEGKHAPLWTLPISSADNSAGKLE